MSERSITHAPVRPHWLALVEEPAIDPARAIVDPHHHLWERPESYYAPDDLAAEIKGCGHNVVATVLIEAHAHYYEDGEPEFFPVGEVENAAKVAEAAEAEGGPRLCAGIVGSVDLTGARVPQVLDAMSDVAGTRFKGIRANSVSHPDPRARGSMRNVEPGLLGRGDFRAGFAHLAPRGLSCDAWMYHTQLDELVPLAKTFETTPIVLNHVGGPIGFGPYKDRRQEVLADWRAALARVAVCPNVSIKLGGFGMGMFGFDFFETDTPPTSQELAKAIRPYTEICIDLFGPERTMFESNFPVDKGSFGYGVMWNAFKHLTADYSDAEKDRLFAGTARSIYQLSL